MDRKLLEDLWHRGWGHAKAARALAAYSKAEAIDSGVDDIEHYLFNGPQSPSMHLLVGFSFELLLKVAMLLNGASTKSVRSVGHDLRKALNKAEQLGFVSRTPQLRFVVEGLREMHFKHHFRYGGAETVSMPGLKISLAVLETLSLQLGEEVYGEPFGNLELKVLENKSANVASESTGP